MRTFRKSVLTFILAATSCLSFGLWGDIDSIKIAPTHPTSVDSITFLVYVSFTSGTCHDKIRSISITPPIITDTSKYCLGPYFYGCLNTDSIKIGPLSPGNYDFYYYLKTVTMDNCIHYLPTDSIIFPFTVFHPAFLPDQPADADLFTIFNSGNSAVSIKLDNDHCTGKLVVYNLLGCQVYSTELRQEETFLRFSLPEGLYLVNVTSQSKSQTKKFIIQSNP
ncbi:MAG TPA: T9SS type A sorting domain-containing protein [Bacteroidales bacterium]|nr:T9SS type A sorting domain-containing protein [Bacteroidales bacterium]HPS74776.1 T9SS type A sorting domain-containing protein [Bacteroidales bacterium]